MWIEEVNGKFKYYERYKDQMTGKTKRVSITLTKNTPASKKQALQELERKIKEAQAIKPLEELTLSDLVNKYRIYQEKTVKASTFKRNYYACNTLISMLGANILINNLSANYIKESFLLSGKTPHSLNEHRVRLKALLNWGYDNDYILSVDYLRKLKPFKEESASSATDRYLEPEELNLLINEMERKSLTHWKLFTQFLVLSGLRIGEAIALNKLDIDLDNKIITVNKTYDPNNNIITTPKTNCSIRSVHIQKELFVLCKLIITSMNQQKMLYGYESSSLFFQSRKGECISYNAFNKYIGEVSLKILSKKITPHVLRHTHASLLLAQSVDIDTISRRLGHENSKVTKEIYLHVTEKLKEKDNAQIENIKII